MFCKFMFLSHMASVVSGLTNINDTRNNPVLYKETMRVAGV